MDFLNIKSQIQKMIGLTLMKMLEEPMDENLLSKLTQKGDYVSTVNSPEAKRDGKWYLEEEWHLNNPSAENPN